MTPRQDDNPAWTIRRVLQWTREEFTRRDIENPRLDAEVLLGHALSLTRMQLYLDLERPLSPAELSGYRALVKRRSAREPVSHIVGRREFWSRPFAVTADTLAPRPETEHLIELALEHRKRALAATFPLAVLDVGTGTGCLAITLKLEWPDAAVTAVDLSPKALEVARQNATALGADVAFLLGDLDAPLPADARFHMVVSNPPYLTESEWEDAPPEVKQHEPRLALVGADADGLGHHRALAQRVWPRLLPGGLMLVELGHQQGASARALWATAVGDRGEVSLVQDLEKRDRVIVARRR
jgi:release factor glutamine methyltransferase